MAKTQVLHYNHYTGPGSQTVYSTEEFCSECRRHLGKPYAFPKYPEEVEADNEKPHGFSVRDYDPNRHVDYWAFCPWCGTEFEDEWWRDRTIQNERAIDHYQNPGTHKGDQHVFEGTDPNCMAGHWLTVSGGTDVCWCDPIVEPGLMGCTIRHQARDYTAVMDQRRAASASLADG